VDVRLVNVDGILEHYCIVYLVFVGEFKKNVTRQTWRVLFHLGE
jgi:hypothetical protein